VRLNRVIDLAQTLNRSRQVDDRPKGKGFQGCTSTPLRLHFGHDGPGIVRVKESL